MSTLINSEKENLFLPTISVSSSISMDYFEQAHLDLLESVRNATGRSTTEWAEDHNLNRVVVYRSAEGCGSRIARVLLAKAIRKPPSEIWPRRGPKVKRLDDEAYYKAIKGRGKK